MMFLNTDKYETLKCNELDNYLTFKNRFTL